MFRRLSAMAISVIVLGSMQAGCSEACKDTPITIQGVVQSADGTPIPNAVIEVTNPDAKRTDAVQLIGLTNAAGYFEFEAFTGSGCDPFNIYVNADRYLEQTLTFNASGEGETERMPETLTITLESD